MSRRLAESRFVPVPTLALILALGFPTFAQSVPPEPPEVVFQAPTAFRVYQRNRDDRATIPVALAEEVEGVEIVGAELSRAEEQIGLPIEGVRFTDGELVGVPAGGPYHVTVLLKTTASELTALTLGPIFVGDLWVLAGQSNMEGYGDLIDLTPPHDRVMVLGMNRQWSRAEEPLHWLLESPDPVHSGDPETREERARQQRKLRHKGAGLGLPFAVTMVEETGIPVGLIACAHGGTSMGQWDPAKKDEGGGSLYGSMLNHVQAAGGQVKGVLWYQGESDALNGDHEAYADTFARFIDSVREDIGQPDLPFYLVQLGRFVSPADPEGWNTVQEAQRLMPERVPFTAVVTAIDLELDDPIHIGTHGLVVLGHRLAHVALYELFGHKVGTTPMLDRVAWGAGRTLVVKLKGVNASEEDYGLWPERHIAGFAIRDAEGNALPLIYETAVGPSRDSVILKLSGTPPSGAQLWYGYGLDPYCNLVDGLDMALPAFGPIPLDEIK